MENINNNQGIRAAEVKAVEYEKMLNGRWEFIGMERRVQQLLFAGLFKFGRVGIHKNKKGEHIPVRLVPILSDARNGAMLTAHAIPLVHLVANNWSTEGLKHFEATALNTVELKYDYHGNSPHTLI